ncbi:bifunctional enoyl-CoA hydratase/phosphate acetyltransferase [mine drainage metagenome]|jgi:phosphotransacetylase|uniref:Bifunctional enoyl-CoA hydratase/phosphate acetyltransferase n=1 Tax=mine drainage metagenome TaxID=410659 RepID=T0YI90_9ZZZZ
MSPRKKQGVLSPTDENLSCPTSFRSILEEARKAPSLRVAVVNASDTLVLEGVLEAMQENFIQPVLLGNPSVINAFFKLNPSPVPIEIIATGSDRESAEKATSLFSDGTVQVLLKGHIHTDTLLHAFLKKIPLPTRLSHVFIAELPSYPKLLFITDAAVNISPDLSGKMAITQNAIDFAILMGVQTPNVAILSATETVNPSIPSTLDAACLAKMSERGQIRGAVIDGPLAFDNAISAESAREKGLKSPVAGIADILVVPDLVSGNILAKNLEYFAGATLAGVVISSHSVPLVLTSRSDPPRSRLLSTAIAVLAHDRLARKKSGDR